MTERQSDAYYRELERRLRTLLPLAGTVLKPEIVGWYSEYLDAGEYGLAVEVAAEGLPTGESPELQRLASALLSEAELMELAGSEVERLRTRVRRQDR